MTPLSFPDKAGWWWWRWERGDGSFSDWHAIHYTEQEVRLKRGAFDKGTRKQHFVGPIEPPSP